MLITLVYNPGAGAGAHSLEQLSEELRRTGARVREVNRQESGWEDRLRERADVVAAAGGDGTAVAVARVLLGSATPILLFPLGTANNAARSFGVPLDVDLIPESWQQWKPRPWHPLRVRSGGEDHLAFEGVGLGTLPAVMCAVSERKSVEDSLELSRRLLRTTLRERSPVLVEVDTPGGSWSCEALLLEALAIGSVGPALPLHPRPALDQESVHLILAEEKDRHPLLEWLRDPRLERNPLQSRVERRATLHATAPMPLHIDDRVERAFEGELEISRHPQAVSILSPLL